MPAAALVLDPVLLRGTGAALSAILLLGCAPKLRDRASFALAVEQYRLLPAAAVAAFATLLPLLEGAAGAGLLFGPTRAVGAALALAVLAVVTAAVAINVMRGRTDIDCGCGGPEGRQRLGWGLVVRNAVLIGAALLAGSDGHARAWVWLDGVTFAGTALALLGLYAAANALLANHPRLAAARSGS